MYGKAARPGGRIDDVLVKGGILHFHAHVDDVPWCEVLAFLTLGRLERQILEGLVDDREVRVEQLDVLKERSTDLKMIWV